MKKLRYALCWLILAAPVGAADGVTLARLHGANQSGIPPTELAAGIGWDRYDFSWSDLEPEPGQWDAAAEQRLLDGVRERLKHGINVLPILCYGTAWSQAPLPREYRSGDRIVRWENAPEPGKYHRIEWVETDGVRRETDRQTVDSTGPGPLAPEALAAWENYVRRLVSALRQPPYELEYFQIWNEASPASGFWNGDLDTWMTQIHLPAARIIRELGGQVVYGGWPCCENNLGDLLALLDRHNAWPTLDVIDIHYFGPSYAAWLRTEARRRGYDVGAWQTEYGFSRDYNVLPQMVMTALDAMLSDRYFDPDSLKLFYFARWSPDDPVAFGYGNCLYRGEQLTGHGQALKNLIALFGRDEITRRQLVFRRDGAKATVTSFQAGDRLVSWCTDYAEAPADATVTLSLADTAPAAIGRIERRGIFGETLDLTDQARVVDGELTVTVPLDEAPDQVFTDGELLPAPDRNRRGMFFVVWQLR